VCVCVCVCVGWSGESQWQTVCVCVCVWWSGESQWKPIVESVMNPHFSYKSQAICSPGGNLLLYSLKCCDNFQKNTAQQCNARCVCAHEPLVPSHFIRPTLLQLIFTRCNKITHLALAVKVTISPINFEHKCTEAPITVTSNTNL